MKAAIYCLKSQQDLCRDIEQLLRENIFERIELKRMVVSDNYGRASAAEEHHSCRSYMRMLKACMIKVDDFRIVVDDGHGNSWYMGYMGIEGDPRGGSSSEKFLKIFHRSMTSAFPAVAVMDRMVMAPQGIHGAFEKSRDFPWLLKPLDLQGVALVDFQYPNQISDAVQQISGQLKAEVVKLCRRHMLVGKIPKPNFSELAKLLNIDKLYLEQHQKEVFASMIKLTPKIVSGAAQLGRLSQVILEITNESENTLRDVRVQVRGPYGTLRGNVRETLNFTAGEKRVQRIQFEVSPKASPYCPLEVMFHTKGMSQTHVPFPIPVIIDVSP